jgi:hypothetical protein
MYKPRGVTRYGQRKQRELRSQRQQEQGREQDERRTALVP